MAVFQSFGVTGSEYRDRIVVLQIGPYQIVVNAIYSHIQVKPVAECVVILGSQHILRSAGGSVDQGDVGSRADLSMRKHLMAQGHSLCLGYQHVVILLAGFLSHIGAAFRNRQGTDNRACQRQHILFIDSQPVFYTITEIFKHHLGKV